ncbi:DNA alkylation repair protein [Neobacillus sp. LXY-4]|uniref:DNA alkylation repair protein n=1 Tax=Neobacillus sp. LXY-4 TaxID=3379826 RepID=UPI003EE075CC
MKLELVREILEEHRNAENAGPMAKYLKNKFPFLGIKSPERRELTKLIFQQIDVKNEPVDVEFILTLWDQAEREYQYVALDYLAKVIKKVNKAEIGLMEKLITTKSWWDTVDTLASQPVGTIVADAKELIPAVIDGWSIHENMWLRRTSILFQLKYKQATDEELLYRYILANAGSKEFFIQKAIGWALREYSKTNPESVKQFIEKNTLMPLSVREGSKYI